VKALHEGARERSGVRRAAAARRVVQELRERSISLPGVETSRNHPQVFPEILEPR
jgi:hypothetical protein